MIPFHRTKLLHFLFVPSFPNHSQRDFIGNRLDDHAYRYNGSSDNDNRIGNSIRVMESLAVYSEAKIMDN